MATLSAAVYAHPQSNQNKLLSLLERAIEKASEQETMTMNTLQRDFLEISRKICLRSSLVYANCPRPEPMITDAPADEMSEAVYIQACNSQKCKIVRDKVLKAKKILSTLKNPSFCPLYTYVESLCGVPTPEPVITDAPEPVTEV